MDVEARLSEIEANLRADLSEEQGSGGGSPAPPNEQDPHTRLRHCARLRALLGRKSLDKAGVREAVALALALGTFGYEDRIRAGEGTREGGRSGGRVTGQQQTKKKKRSDADLDAQVSELCRSDPTLDPCDLPAVARRLLSIDGDRPLTAQERRRHNAQVKKLRRRGIVRSR